MGNRELSKAQDDLQEALRLLLKASEQLGSDGSAVCRALVRESTGEVEEAINHISRELEENVGSKPPSEETVRLHVSDWNQQDKCYDATADVLREFRDKVNTYSRAAGHDAVKAPWGWFIAQIDVGTVKRSYGIEDADLFFDYNNPVESVSEWDLGEKS